MFPRSTPPTLHAICTLSVAIAGCSRGPLDAGREPDAHGVPDAAVFEDSSHRDAGASQTATPDCTPTEHLETTSGAHRCVALTVCGDDEYERFPPTPTTDRVCAPMTRCTAREYESAPPRPGQNRVCTPLTTCAESQYEVEAPTSTTDRRCARLTDCRRGECVEIEATETRDRACAACPPGTFSDRDNAGACAAWTECSEGGWIAEGTSTSDRECECLA